MKNLFRTCALGVGVLAMSAASALNAASFHTDPVMIPFQFRVANVTMPAGEYRVKSEMGNDITFLENVKTGQQVQILRTNGTATQGRTRLIFEVLNGAYKLKTIS